MVVLGGGAVSYERGTPVQVVKLLTAVAKQRARCVAFAMGMQVRGHDPPGHLWRDKWISAPPATYGVTSALSGPLSAGAAWRRVARARSRPRAHPHDPYVGSSKNLNVRTGSGMGPPRGGKGSKGRN